MVNMFEHQLISILIDKISKLQRGKMDEKPDFALCQVNGIFLNPNGWELSLPLCNNVKFEKIKDGYLFTPDYSSQSFKILTNLSNLDLDCMSKTLYLKYSGYKYPILYNDHILDLGDYIMGNKFDYGSLRMIHYAADDSSLEMELKNNFDIFITDVLPNVKDLILEFSDSIESEVTYEVCNVLDRPVPISNYESIVLFDVKVPKQVNTISTNAFNYFRSGLIYQIENMLKAEKLDIKIDLVINSNALQGFQGFQGVNIQTDLIRLYFPVNKTKISPITPKSKYGLTGSNGPTGSYGETFSRHEYCDYRDYQYRDDYDYVRFRDNDYDRNYDL